MIQHRQFATGPLEVTSSLIYSEKSLIVIDPGDNLADRLQKIGPRENVTVLLTHAHIDHVAGVGSVLDCYPQAVIVLNKKDEMLLQNLDYQAETLGFLPVKQIIPGIVIQGDGEMLAGDIPVRYLEIGGHTAGSTVFIIDGIIYTGDTLFNHVIGRTDLMGSTTHQELVGNIRKKLMVFDDEMRVIPGHGPATSIGFERKNNLYVGTRG